MCRCCCCSKSFLYPYQSNLNRTRKIDNPTVYLFQKRSHNCKANETGCPQVEAPVGVNSGCLDCSWDTLVQARPSDDSRSQKPLQAIPLSLSKKHVIQKKVNCSWSTDQQMSPHYQPQMSAPHWKWEWKWKIIHSVKQLCWRERRKSTPHNVAPLMSAHQLASFVESLRSSYDSCGFRGWLFVKLLVIVSDYLIR